MPEYELKKLTNEKWVNMYEVKYKDKTSKDRKWLMCSRKDNPIADAARPDAVIIIATIDTEQGRKLVVTKEFRIPINDYEYGFPAGLIDDGEDIASTVHRELKEETGLDLVKINHISTPVYSSAGLTDESCTMVLAEATGTVSAEFLEENEEIETILMTVQDIKDLLSSNKKIAAKAWGMLYYYVQKKTIE